MIKLKIKYGNNKKEILFCDCLDVMKSGSIKIYINSSLTLLPAGYKNVKIKFIDK